MKYGDPSVNEFVENDTTETDRFLISFEGINIFYCPTKKQVYLQNESPIASYFVQFRYNLKNIYLGKVDTAEVPQINSQSVPYSLNPSRPLYFTPSGEYDSDYAVDTISAYFVLEDLSISSTSGLTFGADLSNEHISTLVSPDTNRILMSTLISSYT